MMRIFKTNYMSNNLSFTFVFVLFLILINFRQTFAENITENNIKSISDANNYFAFNLLKELFDENQNVLVSPFSITTVLSMLYFGAKDRTATELEDVLALRQLNLTKEQIGEQFRDVLNNQLIKANTSDYEFTAANRLVVQSRNAILDEYAKQLRDYFNSSVQTVDFLFKSDEAVHQINQWISEATGGRIAKLLDQPLSPLNVLVLLNAVYFKGLWRERFLKWATKEEDFHGLNQVIKVAHMKLSNQFNYTTISQLNGSQLIEVPYSGSDMAMYVLLADRDTRFKSIVDNLTVGLFDEAIANLTVTTVRLVLPKFKITSSYALKNSLQAMGIQQAFTYKSDLSGIDSTTYYHISEVYHKVICEVNEEGSEATTVTGVATTRGLFGRYRNVPTFRADHPFVFIIRHKSTGMIIFVGLLNRP